MICNNKHHIVFIYALEKNGMLPCQELPVFCKAGCSESLMPWMPTDPNFKLKPTCVYLFNRKHMEAQTIFEEFMKTGSARNKHKKDNKTVTCWISSMPSCLWHNNFLFMRPLGSSTFFENIVLTCKKSCVLNAVFSKASIWLVVYLPLWNILVSWDDDIPNRKKIFQTTNQVCIQRNPAHLKWCVS